MTLEKRAPVSLPPWATRALDHFKPLPGFRDTEPDPARLRQWEGFRARFEKRWNELAPDQWKVPEDHSAYAWLRFHYTYPPADYVRQCILEVAIECAWEMGANQRPGGVIAAVKELDSLNDQISQAAAHLASLFRQRDQLRDSFSLSDSSPDAEASAPDAFRLAGLFELVFSKHRFRTASYHYKAGLESLYDALSSSNGAAPTIADLLDEISCRMPRVVTPFDAGDIAIMGSKTNRSDWSPWALRLVARLSDWAGNGLPDGFFLACLTHDQLATLLTVALDAPPEAYNGPQMRELIKRHKARAAR
ncbi:MAG: hypothetical protein PWQ61_2365 [Betaproteobacteria bacterium]|nr:hypothetical protein [Betaproteobacteria bacterium]